MDALHNLLKVCQQQGVQLVLAGLSHQPLDILQRTGFLALLGSADVVADLSLALAALKVDAPHL